MLKPQSFISLLEVSTAIPHAPTCALPSKSKGDISVGEVIGCRYIKSGTIFNSSKHEHITTDRREQKIYCEIWEQRLEGKFQSAEILLNSI